MARRSDHSHEELKALVLQAAETIIIEDGYAALNMRTLALDIGYTVGSVYMVFANRADLLMHINARTLEALSLAMAQTPKASGLPAVEALALAYLSYARQHFNRWSMVFDPHNVNKTPIPAWYQAKIDHLFAALETQLAQLAPHTPPAELAQAVWALGCGIQGVCLLSLKADSKPAQLKHIENTLKLLVRNFVGGWTMASTSHGLA